MQKKFPCVITTHNILLFSFLNQLSLFGTLKICFRLIMKFVLKPSLEHMTLVQIAVSLWNQHDVRALIINHTSEYLYSKENWKTIEERVIEKVSWISLPQPLKEKVLGFIKPVGIEIALWMEYNYKYLPAHLPATLCWTPQGAVDRKRTAEVLVKDENLNVLTRYMLACDYCLEGDIIRFWNSLPENVKDYDWENFSIVSFWSGNMKRGGAGHISYKHVFYRSAHEGNVLLCLLLPEMEEEEQVKVLKKNPQRVLHCFLQWPWQSFFIQVANCMWNFLSKSNYDEILGDIIGKVRDGYKDYNYQKLFGEFWQKSPSALKDLFIDEIDHSWILHSLFDIKDKENIQLILKDASFTTKEQLIYSDEIDDYLTRSVWANEWDFLEFCIRECLPSKDEMLKFKEEFEMRSPYTKEHLAKNKHKWSQIFCISDDSICKYDKRSIEEDESSSSKRFQSLQ